MDEYIRWIRFMPNSIKPSLMRPAYSYAWIFRDDIMENIITRTVPGRRKTSKNSGANLTHCQSRTAMRELEKLGTCVLGTGGLPLLPDRGWEHS